MELSGRLGRIANAVREAGRHDLAIALLHHSYAFAETRRERTVATLRLGEAYRAAHRLDESERTLRGALSDVEPGYRDFALQHLGKCLADAGRAEEARACLNEALVLRRAKGDPELIASTEAALAGIDRASA